MIVIPQNAYPLAWPPGVPRTEFPKKSNFGHVHHESGQFGTTRRMTPRQNGDGISFIRRQLKNLDAVTIVISSNLQLRSDGLPYADGPQRPAGDAGVAVYWTRNERRRGGLQLVPYCMPCDAWERIADNLYAIGLSIEAMRGMERWGCVSVEQAFSGFAALPPGSGETVGVAEEIIDWRTLLADNRPWPEGVEAVDLLQIVRGRYRILVAKAHPDRGGDQVIAASLNRALEAAEKELGA
ncbi:MAG TPA: hypothetical protein VFD36_20505 [Kofleriaceae bacterium]|nr:hypothetical protein [Kofleriaceae bacterium]